MLALLQVFQLVGPNHAVQLFGVRLVGVNAENGGKLIFSLAFLVLVWLIRSALRRLGNVVLGSRSEHYRFWMRQAVQVFTVVLLIIGLASIWFDDPTRLATALGLVTAGLAFALQRVVTAIAGYFVILRGKTFTVGDRIAMGGVRGDVIALTFTQTTIMEMGQPPAVQGAEPAMWVRARQYTGRVVTVTNAKIFDEPIYNYTRDFPFLWEELAIPISYKDDRRKAEQILLDVAGKHSVQAAEMGEQALQEMQRRYVMETVGVDPRVFLRITDNWVELTIRFVVREHGVRDIKDKMSREILQQFDEAGIGIASATFEITGVPELTLKRAASQQTNS